MYMYILLYSFVIIFVGFLIHFSYIFIHFLFICLFIKGVSAENILFELADLIFNHFLFTSCKEFSAGVFYS